MKFNDCSSRNWVERQERGSPWRPRRFIQGKCILNLNSSPTSFPSSSASGDDVRRKTSSSSSSSSSYHSSSSGESDTERHKSKKVVKKAQVRKLLALSQASSLYQGLSKGLKVIFTPFSQTRPCGPSWSNSRDVCLCVVCCLCVCPLPRQIHTAMWRTGNLLFTHYNRLLNLS